MTSITKSAVEEALQIPDADWVADMTPKNYETDIIETILAEYIYQAKEKLGIE